MLKMCIVQTDVIVAGLMCTNRYAVCIGANPIRPLYDGLYSPVTEQVLRWFAF